MEIKFTDNSEEVLEALAKAISRALWSIGATAEGYAKKDTPVDTGRLRNSIAHDEDEKEQATYIGTNVEYAPFIELGAAGRKPYHMLQNAATSHSNEYKSLVEDSLKNA